MVSVIVAVVAAMGGVLAGALPTVLVSERRRLLKFVQEESAALEVVKDKNAKSELQASLRASASRYKYLASMSPKVRARNRLLRFMPALLPPSVIAFGAAVSLSFFPGEYDAATNNVQLGLVGVSFLLLLPLFLMSLSHAHHSREETRQRREVQQSRERERQAKAELAKAQEAAAAASRLALEQAAAAMKGMRESRALKSQADDAQARLMALIEADAPPEQIVQARAEFADLVRRVQEADQRVVDTHNKMLAESPPARLTLRRN